MAEHHRMFVDGEWIEAADGGAFAVSDPATGEMIAEVADGGPSEALRAVEAAQRAFPGFYRPGHDVPDATTRSRW
jgi:acyl-CoA reductase-like NAD-dependent aldehyde dehydrogenase